MNVEYKKISDMIEEHLSSNISFVNNQVIRNSIEKQIHNYLDNLSYKNYEVICDKTNNTQESINQKQIIIDILIDGVPIKDNWNYLKTPSYKGK